MRILDARLHRLADVAFALAFVLGPLVFGLGGSPAVFSFLFAVAFVLLAATVWRRGRHAAPVVSILHGLIELAITIVLAVLPIVDGYAPGSPARRFVWTMAILVGVVWTLTAYGERSSLSREAPAAR
ncbi:MAG TPA: hypothetical protein VMN82_13890 [Thermoanaerobaculia bacterium]|nr:hypothetical protein [Thermoanaerobaculia bacterium]